LFERRLAEIPNEPTARLFPFKARRAVQRFCKAKKRLQVAHPELFKNLRMHDNRAFCFTGLLKKGYTVTQVRKGVSLHSHATSRRPSISSVRYRSATRTLGCIRIASR
jgi:hypothetical protein